MILNYLKLKVKKDFIMMKFLLFYRIKIQDLIQMILIILKLKDVLILFIKISLMKKMKKILINRFFEINKK